MLETKFPIDGKEIKIRVDYPLYISENGLSAAGENYAELVISLIDDAKALCADDILIIYNDAWVDDDHPALTKEQFLAQISFDEIEILDEPDYAIIYFSDGGLFSGHTIAVTVVGNTLDGADLL